MLYAYWKDNRHMEHAVFELFFRKNPFKGEFTVFAGLDEVVNYLSHFQFSDVELEYLKTILPNAEEEFFDVYLRSLDLSNVTIRSVPMGCLVFPRCPLLQVEGPLGICQLIETTLLNLVNYPSLIATNAARMRLAVSLPPIYMRGGGGGEDEENSDGMRFMFRSFSVDESKQQQQSQSSNEQQPPKDQILDDDDGIIGGTNEKEEEEEDTEEENVFDNEPTSPQPPNPKDIQLLEFGLRRAQGPDGGFSASKYSFVGGFDGSSNVLSGLKANIPIKGTHAHSFVMSYGNEDLVKCENTCSSLSPKEEDQSIDITFYDLCLKVRATLGWEDTNDGEMAAFMTYAAAFPNTFLALVDTYNTLRSGVRNFIIVSLGLVHFGYFPLGIRLDSGDLAYLSKECRKTFMRMGSMKEVSITLNENEENIRIPTACFSKSKIVASNDINEKVLLALHQQVHCIDVFGIGTNLVTCQAQPALGCVYKLVELNGKGRIKLSEVTTKVQIPGSKRVYRFCGSSGYPLVDVMQVHTEEPPQEGVQMLVRHPFHEIKRVNVTPKTIIPLLQPLFEDGQLVENAYENFNLDLKKAKKFVNSQLRGFRVDHIRFSNPTPYKVSVSQSLYSYLHDMWLQESPVQELT